jgi:ribonuclease Y
MIDNILPIIVGIAIGLAIGYIVAKYLEKTKATKILRNTKREATAMIREAKVEADILKKDKILQAKEKFIELKSEHEKVIITRDKKIAEAEKRVRDKESQVSQLLDKNKKLNIEVATKVEDYDKKIEYFERRSEEVDKMHRKQVENLEVISGLSAEDAKKELEALRAINTDRSSLVKQIGQVSRRELT